MSTVLQTVALLLAASAASARLLPPAHGGLHEQIAAVTQAIGREPKNAALYLRRAELERLHGDCDRALADLRRAEELDERLEGLALQRARILCSAGRTEAAERALDRVLADRPEHSEALLLRSKVRKERGALLLAREDCDRLLRTLPEPRPDHYLLRAEIIVALGPEHLSEAVSGIDEGLEKLGPCAPLLLRAVDLELAQARYDAALERIAVLARSSARQESWLARRGEILVAAGRLSEARAAWRAALAAIDGLPPKQRATRAVNDLRSKLRERLAGLDRSIESTAVAPPSRKESMQ